MIAALPASTFIDGLPTRLKAEKTCDVTMTVGFHLSDSDHSYAIRLRRGVARSNIAHPTGRISRSV
ncbi:alkyl sulfatase C-terminal domain-containing protein [Bradyrhizobium sp.]|uniref:alkyl sulfatase C-terminal domain-containing protein n=1 Tax=Bradyrhizobium sp. TaxID=376 RepID=UPI003BB0F1E7